VRSGGFRQANAVMQIQPLQRATVHIRHELIERRAAQPSLGAL